MGFLKRMSNIVSSKANKALDKVEDPIEQIDLAIRKREEAINKAKLESASFIGSISQKKSDTKKLQQKISQYEDGIRKALAAEEEDKARTFLAKKKELDSELESLETTIESLEVTATKVKQNVQMLEKEVKDLKTKKSELAARYSTAKAQAKVNEVLSDLNKDANISLSDIEEKIAAQENYANGLDAFKEKSLDDELSEYLNDSNQASLDDDLDKYRS